MSNAAGAVLDARASTETLVVGVAAGDRAAEQQFVRDYRDGVRVLVRRHCRANEPMLDDLVQDALQSVLLHLRAGELRDPLALPAYVRRTVAFIVAAEYRKRGRRGPSDELDADHASQDDDPERAAIRAQTGTAVKRLLAEMTVPRDRDVLRLFYLDELDKDEVCTALAIEPSHFHRVLFRARQRLAELARSAGLTRG